MQLVSLSEATSALGLRLLALCLPPITPIVPPHHAPGLAGEPCGAWLPKHTLSGALRVLVLSNPHACPCPASAPWYNFLRIPYGGPSRPLGKPRPPAKSCPRACTRVGPCLGVPRHVGWGPAWAGALVPLSPLLLGLGPRTTLGGGGHSLGCA